MLTFATVLEALTSPIAWRITHTSAHEFEATFGSATGIDYTLTLRLTSSAFDRYSHWQAVLSANDARVDDPLKLSRIKHDADGEQFRVVSTIITILRDFNKKKSPGTIAFRVADPSRLKMTGHLANLIKSDLPGYHAIMTNNGSVCTIERDTPLGGYLK